MRLEPTSFPSGLPSGQSSSTPRSPHLHHGRAGAQAAQAPPPPASAISITLRLHLLHPRLPAPLPCSSACGRATPFAGPSQSALLPLSSSSGQEPGGEVSEARVLRPWVHPLPGPPPHSQPLCLRFWLQLPALVPSGWLPLLPVLGTRSTPWQPYPCLHICTPCLDSTLLKLPTLSEPSVSSWARPLTYSSATSCTSHSRRSPSSRRPAF